MRIGFQGGTHIANVTEASDWEWRARAYGGIVVDVEISDCFLLAAQINYIEKWLSRDMLLWGVQVADGFYRTTFELKYLEMPIYLRWRPGHSNVRWFVEFGPIIDRLVSAWAEIWGSRYGIRREDLGDSFRRTDVSLSAGSGLEITLGTSTFFTVSAHYEYGLMDISMEMRGRTRGIQAALGVMFAL
jgi:hypothetical protein